AQRLFLGIMLSEWQDCLCKCRYQYCGRYFVHPKPRSCYRRGTFCCREHAGRAAADEAPRQMRKQGRERLIEVAARRLIARRIEEADWRNNTTMKRRLVQELCEVIRRQRLHGYQQVVGLRWVSRHQDRIERMRLELSGGDQRG